MVANKKNKLAEIVEAQNNFLKQFGLGAAIVPYADEGADMTGWKG